MVIGSIIGYYFGASSTKGTIGYCKESPIEVLEKLIQTHYIHSYKNSFCTPTYYSPSIHEGITIYPAYSENMKGVSIIGNLSDLMDEKLIKQAEWDKFSLQNFKSNIEELTTYAEHFDDTNTYKSIYREIVKDLNIVFAKLFDEDENRKTV